MTAQIRPNTTSSVNPGGSRRRNIGALNYTTFDIKNYPMSNKMQAFKNMFIDNKNNDLI